MINIGSCITNCKVLVGPIGDQPDAVRCHTVCTFRGLDNSYIYDTLTYTDSAIKIPQFKTSLQALFMGIKDPSFGA